MQQSRTSSLTASYTMGWLASVVVIFLGAAHSALAADHRISPQVSSFNCSNVRPGDTVTLDAGTRGPLTIRDCNGSATNPIRIRNDAAGSGPTVIQRTSGSAGGFVFSCNSCIGVVIDGSNKWRGAPTGKTYGIKVTMTGGSAPSAFLRIGGMSRFLTIRNVEVDGTWPRIADNGIGISVNDHTIKRDSHPGLWREGIVIEHSYVHDIEGEGMYVGPNYDIGALPLRDITIRFNLVEDIGWEGINTKSMWEGNNSIHHNVVRRAGKNGSNSNKPTQYSGINNNAGSVKIYNNWVEKTGQHGIQWYNPDGPYESSGRAPFEVQIWNNVIVDAGSLWRSFMAESHGINVGATSGAVKAVVHIYNNTFINPRQSAVRVASEVSGGFVRDNIVADAGEAAIKAPTVIKQANNRIGGVSEMAFVDPDRFNFRLRAESPARDQGGSAFPDVDFDDIKRPQHGTPDQGAFEYNSGEGVAAPEAPAGLVVE